MENYKQFLVLLCLTLMMSCDYGKNNSPNHFTIGSSVSENKEITNTTHYKSTGNFDAMVENSVGNDKLTDSLNENWNLDNPKRKVV